MSDHCTTVLEYIPQKVFMKDRNSVYVGCNRHLARDLQIEPEDIVGKTDYDFFSKELAEKYRADDRRIMDSGEGESIEEEYVYRDRKEWVLTRKVPVRDEKGEVAGIAGIFEDITERKRTEEMLRHAAEEWQSTFDANSDGLMLMEPDGTIRRCNRAMQRILEMTSDAIVGRQCFCLVHSSDQPIGECPVRQLAASPDRESVTIETFAAGRWWSVTANAVRNGSGELRAIIHVMSDVTARKKAELELTAYKDHLEELVAKRTLELQRLYDQLKEAFERIKTLSGLIPICAYCKKIRDDKGFWTQIERYIHEHSDASFTHGVCPECAKKVMEDFEKVHGAEWTP